MRRAFQSWLAEYPIDEDSRVLFEESIRCERAGAYRAALFLSFTGLARAVAARLSVALAPQEYPLHKWQEMQKRVLDRDYWEQATLRALLSEQPSVFLIDDDLREQLRFWQGRRDDAIRWRGTDVTGAHVESIWSFIRSHLVRMVVAGGFDELLLRVERHFDPEFTAPGSDLSPLIAEIPTMIPPPDHGRFLRRAIDLTLGSEDLNDPYRYEPLPESTTIFVRRVISAGDGLIIKSFVEQLAADDQLLVRTLLVDPQFVSHLPPEPSLIRRLWYELLPVSVTPPGERQWQATLAMEVFLELLRQGLVPKEEQSEAVHHLVGRLSEGEPRRFCVPDEYLDPRDSFGILSAIRHHAFEQPDVEWAADNLDLICEHLLRFPADTTVASTFIRLVPKRIPEEGPGDHYHWMEYVRLSIPEDFARLRYFFSRYPKKYEEVIEVAKDSDLACDAFATEMKPDPSLFAPVAAR